MFLKKGPGGHLPIISAPILSAAYAWQPAAPFDSRLPKIESGADIIGSRGPDPIFSDQERAETLINKQSPLRRSGKTGAVNCKARILPILLLFFTCEWSVFLSEGAGFYIFYFPFVFLLAVRRSYSSKRYRVYLFLLASTFCLPCS